MTVARLLIASHVIEPPGEPRPVALVEAVTPRPHDVEIVLLVLHHLDDRGVVAALLRAGVEVHAGPTGALGHVLDVAEPLALEDVAAHAAGVVLVLEVKDRAAQLQALRLELLQ